VPSGLSGRWNTWEESEERAVAVASAVVIATAELPATQQIGVVAIYVVIASLGVAAPSVTPSPWATDRGAFSPVGESGSNAITAR
jgi:hypothetical protein